MEKINYKIYQNPLCERYASKEMLYNFSPEKKFIIWRKLWIALAQAEKELELPISQSQIDEMKKFQDKINYATARNFEEITKHDVMAHIKAFGQQCPTARPIIHLGATSAYVVDNTDLILARDGLSILRQKLLNVINILARFAKRYAETPCVGYTHFQPAQLTTVGKRACLWLNDLVIDLAQLDNCLSNLKFLGVKGAVGTQASFVALFNGDKEKISKLDELVTKKMGFKKSLIISGQTYTRKIDMLIHTILVLVAQSASKCANDIRLLQHLKELEEPFDEKQVGSSAMAYKKNPIKCERIVSLARLVIILFQNPAMTASNQWLERTLDDSASKRIVVPEAFLATDAILSLYYHIVKHIKVNEDMIRANVEKNLPFIASENILMEIVKRGGDRGIVHERIRQSAIKSTSSKEFLEKLLQDKIIKKYQDVLPKVLKQEDFIGCSSNQVKEFLRREVMPIIRKNKHLLGLEIEIKI